MPQRITIKAQRKTSNPLKNESKGLRLLENSLRFFYYKAQKNRGNSSVLKLLTLLDCFSVA
jgi:hypothetical protein